MTSKDRSPFGERMLEARTKSRLKQSQVCQRLGISQGTLSQLERTSQGSSRIAEFAELYGVSPLWLATGDGSMTAKVSGMTSKSRWPFELIPKERWDALSERQKGAVEQAALNKLEEIEHSMEALGVPAVGAKAPPKDSTTRKVRH